MADLSSADLEPWAAMESQKHRHEAGGCGCTCGFCMWSIEHVVIMSIRDGWPAMQRHAKPDSKGCSRRGDDRG